MRRFLVVGTGRAGQARMRALTSRSDIVGIALSARSDEFESTFDGYMTDSLVEAVLVCTDNARHFDIALRALNAGKHVLVEFPLTHSTAEAVRLYAAAKNADRVLHVEFIGLMTGAHLAHLKMDTQSWHRVKVIMTGGLYRWVESEYQAHRVGALMNGRLQALHHLLGELKLKDVGLHRFSDGYRLSVDLIDRKGTQIEISDTRRVDLKRVRKMEIYDKEDHLIEPGKAVKSASLFATDLEVFCRKIQGVDTQWSLPTESDIVEVIRLSEAISHQCISTLG